MKPTRSTCMRRDGTGFITLVLPGDPIGKPRQTRRDRWQRRACVVRYRAWADALRALARELPADPPARVDVTAHMELPASWSKAKKAELAGKPHRAKPDVDNIAKAVLDALWPDGDEAIAWIHARKVWATEGAEGSVTVTIHYDASDAKPKAAGR